MASAGFPEAGDVGETPAMVPVGVRVRAHDLERDLDWLPGRLRHLRLLKSVLPGALLAMTVAIVASANATFALVLGWPLGLVLVAAYYAGDRLAKRLVRGRMGRLARGLDEVRALGQQDDGARVHLRGRVRAAATVPGLLSDEPGVLSRATIRYARSTEGRLVVERGVDFRLVGNDGAEALVLIEGARLIVRDPPWQRLPAQVLGVLVTLPLPDRWRWRFGNMWFRFQQGQRIAELRGCEYLLREGDEVWVLGEKSRVLDGSVAHLERQTPYRITLCSGKELPLLITPVIEAEKRLGPATQRPLLTGRTSE